MTEHVQIDPDVFYPPGSFFLTKIPGRTGWWVGMAQAVLGMPSRWTHAGVVLGGGRIIQAQPGGAVVADLEGLLGQEHIVCDAPVREALARSLEHHPAPELHAHYIELEIRDDVVDAARSYEGIGYSFLDYVALAVWHLEQWLRGRQRAKDRPWRATRWLRHRVESSRHLICSALVDRVYDEVGIHLWDDGRLAGDVTPSDLDGWAQAHWRVD